MKNAVNDVIEFHHSFGHPVRCVAKFPKKKELDFAHKLIKDEVEELDEAIVNNDLVETVDACADIVFTCVGLMARCGVDFASVWDEVCRSNMAKLGADGKPILRDDGKILKPSDWIPPNIKDSM